MNKTKAKPSTGEGWAVHVYDSDRATCGLL